MSSDVVEQKRDERKLPPQGRVSFEEFLEWLDEDTLAEWLDGVKTVALTAGASAPEVLVEQVAEFLKHQGFTNVHEVEVMPENVRFGLPPEIVEAIEAAPAAVVE